MNRIGSYKQYVTRCYERGLTPLDYRGWLQRGIEGVWSLIRSVEITDEREEAFFEQFRGDDSAEQPDPFYPRGINIP